MRANSLLLFDFILYFIFPLFFWEFARSYIGDYITMLLSTVPGILYTLFRFNLTERFNFTGIFIILNLSFGVLLDVLSVSAQQLQWNNVFYAIALAIIYLISYFLKKPIHLFFTLDIMVLKGYDKTITKKFFYEKKPLKLFNILTIIYSISECVYALIMIKWISIYGVEAFHLDILLDNTLNIVMTGVSILSFIYVNNMIDEIVSIKKILKQKSTRKHFHSYTLDWYANQLERSYFYFSNHKR